MRKSTGLCPQTCRPQLCDLTNLYRVIKASRADFAVVQSYLSTAAKWGISKLHALRDLFTGHAWLSPGIEPSG